MPMLTNKTFLMLGSGTGTITYSKLVDIKDYPDVEDSPETVETTTLTDEMRTYIPGLKSPGGSALPFTCNYDEAIFSTIRGYEGQEKDLGLFLGDTTGSDGKFTFKGYLAVRLLGKGVGEVREMEVSVVPSSVITFETVG